MSSSSNDDMADVASPEVRRLAHQLNVDLTFVTPSGPDGTVTVADVQRVHRMLADIGPLEMLHGARKAMARSMGYSRDEIMHSCVCDDANLAMWNKEQHTTLRLIRGISAAVRAVPALNAWFDGSEFGRRILPKIHLGISVEVPSGQFICVMQDVGSRDRESLQKGLEKMRKAVADHTVAPEELRGYTICLANMGKHGGRYSMTAVVPPTVAVIAAGRRRDAVMPVHGQPRVVPVLPLALTFDHRAVTNGEAARGLEAMINDLEKPT